MEDRRALLRRKMALLQRWLREGVPSDVATDHLRDMIEAESELRSLEREKQ